MTHTYELGIMVKNILFIPIFLTYIYKVPFPNNYIFLKHTSSIFKATTLIA